MCQTDGNVSTFPVPSRSRQVIVPLITQDTKPGSLYYTDDWHAYDSVSIRGNQVLVEIEKGHTNSRDHLTRLSINLVESLRRAKRSPIESIGEAISRFHSGLL